MASGRSHRPPCRFHSKPGGCRNGSSCPFAHIDGAPSPPGQSAPRQPAGGRPPVPNAPPGICRFYYDRGFCSRGSECRFRHEVKPAQSRPATDGTVSENVAAFLTPAALARIQGSGTDGFFDTPVATMKPSEVRHHLNRFLEDGYRFKYAADVYGFVTLLSNASSGNMSWSPEDGQLFLSSIGTDIGLLRIGDILGWSEISIRPTARTTLSFQRGYVPLLRYLSSEYVVKSITSKVVNSLYSLVLEHFDHFYGVVKSCMEQALNEHKSFRESMFGSNQPELTGSQVLSCIAQVLFEYITRFKNAVATHPSLRPFVQDLRTWTESWITAISATPPTFEDPITKAPAQASRFVIDRLRELVERLVSIVDRKQRDIERANEPHRALLPAHAGLARANEGVLAALHNAYQGPGALRAEGPRHDNDFVNIGDIQIAPTHGELTSPLQPFLPANMYGAPHPLPAESMEQLLDIQFRLLREELTASLRVSAQAILSDQMERERGKHTQLDEVIKKKGGKYRGHAVGQDTVLFNVYTGAEFTTITPTQRGLTAGVTMDTPPGRARAGQAKTRIQFWESMSSKRLMQGGLVALVWRRLDGTTEVHLGTIASSSKDLTESVKHGSERLEVRVSFFSPEVELRILQELRLPLPERRGMKLLIEATVMFESVRPFLEALRVDPENIPFARYLAHHPPEFYRTLQISPPAYATLPGFSFQLASLFPQEAGVDDLKLVVNDAESIETARDLLRRSSPLDPSQADAIVDALTREVSLIQGPPGTGKSYSGVELLRVLIKNNAGPILMIAFTNHALDHMLRSVLDADITQEIVRLGSRSADERIAEFSLEQMENVAGRSRLSSAFSKYRWALRDVEKEIQDFMQSFFKESVDAGDILRHLVFQAPALSDSIVFSPPWVGALHELQKAEKDTWHTAGRNKPDTLDPDDDSLYGFWVRGGDIEFLHSTHRALLYRRPPSPLRQPVQLQQPARPANPFELLSVEADDKPVLIGNAGAVAEEDYPPTNTEDPDVEVSDEELVDVLPEEEWLVADFVADLVDPVFDAEEDDDYDYDIEPLPSKSTHPSPPSPPAATSGLGAPGPITGAPAEAGPSASIQPDDFTDIRRFFEAYYNTDARTSLPFLLQIGHSRSS